MPLENHMENKVTEQVNYSLELPPKNYQQFVIEQLQTPVHIEYKTFDDLVGIKCRFFYHNQSIGVGFNATPYRSITGYVLVDNHLPEAHIDLRDGVEIDSVSPPPSIITDKTIKFFVYLKDKETHHA